MKRLNIKKAFSVCLVIVLLSMLTACNGNTLTKDATSKEGANKFTIVTSFYPIYIAALNVAKDIEGVEVINMTEPITGCLHDYTISPKDMKTLEDAQVFVINGAGMESFMESVISQLKDLKIVEASKGIELIEGDGEIENNPHVWVSISNAITEVQNIESQLSAIDPSHSEAYKKNAKAYIQKLEEIRSKMHEALDNVSQKDIVTFHEAFPYFAKEFNLNIAGVVEREPGSEPSAKELGETVDQIKTLGIKALFAEPQYPKRAAEVIANETGAKVYTLDPAVTGPMEADAYIQIMTKNLEVLKEALK
ncbi:MAG: ABC-type metal ion transport system, periplasmic component/surface adhesin [Clostridia bacterium]|nr:ABC-type metal ion transport system, periplasmic component/surface adhesin [Clostridia bacterium]